MAVHNPLNAFSFDISLIEIGQEIKLLEHLKKIWITLYILNFRNDRDILIAFYTYQYQNSS
jgi:hypothetical protein